MGFFIWHYTKGLQKVIYFFDLLLNSIVNNFSFIVLIKTLFYPWRRMLAKDTTPGFNLEIIFTNLTFDLISRGIGFFVHAWHCPYSARYPSSFATAMPGYTHPYPSRIG